LALGGTARRIHGRPHKIAGSSALVSPENGQGDLIATPNAAPLSPRFRRGHPPRRQAISTPLWPPRPTA